MPTYLLKWDPKVHPASIMAEDAEKLRRQGYLDDGWNCGVTKRIRPGDRVFLLRTNSPLRGIVGSGTVTQGSFQGPHYARPGKMTWSVKVRFDVLLHPETDEILKLERLETPEFAGCPWHVQGCGKSIPPEPAMALEAVWASFLAAHGKSPPRLAEEVMSPSGYFEGATCRISVNAYERSAYAREECVRHHGYCCAVCGFDFEKVYGAVGRAFIHVHHLKPLSEIREEYVIDPIADLRPICPNCHAMIHRGAEMLSIEQLKQKLRFCVGPGHSRGN